MQTAIDTFDVPSLQSAWEALDHLVHLRPIHDENNYNRMVDLMNTLLDTVGNDETHVLFGLLEIVGALISAYDAKHYPIKDIEPKEALRYLIEQGGLKQNDLAHIIPQGNLSAILSGKRKINAALAGKLAGFFSVSPAVFIPAGI
ncbi:MAG: transcriptional regulator [Pseudomonadota bacterium]|nr:transcriptional regulator [Pseudomonadota bacterium]